MENKKNKTKKASTAKRTSTQKTAFKKLVDSIEYDDTGKKDKKHSAYVSLKALERLALAMNDSSGDYVDIGVALMAVASFLSGRHYSLAVVDKYGGRTFRWVPVIRQVK